MGPETSTRWIPTCGSDAGSARTGWGLGVVKRLLVDRTTLFCGPSGAGKSSLLNALAGSANKDVKQFAIQRSQLVAQFLQQQQQKLAGAAKA